MGYLNYNTVEASNLSLGQAGFASFTNVQVHKAEDYGATRWVGILIMSAAGGSSIVLESNTGDDLTISTTAVADLIGSVISGDFHTVTGGGHQIMAFKG